MRFNYSFITFGFRRPLGGMRNNAYYTLYLYKMGAPAPPLRGR